MDNLKDRIDLESLVGPHIITGCECDTTQVLEWGERYVSAGCLRFIMDGQIYEAIENPDDGYRSSLEGLHIADDGVTVANVFDPIEVLGVYRDRGKYGGTDDVLELRRVTDGSILIEIGTADINDYYPGCVMAYNP